MKLAFCLAASVLVFVAWAAHPQDSLAGDGRSLSRVNGSIRAEAGQAYESLSTVNGNVRVSSGATADVAKTVNGDVTLENDARIGRVSTVNGSLRIGEGASVGREASTVNGSVKLDRRSRVDGDISTVSGEIELRGAEVTGTLSSVNGDIDLTEGAHVRGGDYEGGNIELGYSIGKPYWGKGYATEAVRAVAEFAADLSRGPVMARHFADNPASGRVLAKAGFTYSGERQLSFSLARGEAVPSLPMERKALRKAA